MATFLEWLVHRNTATALRLLETTDPFRPEDYNAVFDQELSHIHDPAAREQVEAMRGFNWANYIVRSLVRAGFRGDNLQETFHDLVIRLLVKPGKLFKGWNSTHGPLQRRFYRSVQNGIINSVEKARNRGKWMTATDPVALAERLPNRPDHSRVMETFRQHVAHRLGTLALHCLDWRIDGKDIKDLVGRPDLGRPTAYMVKREVAAIKELARRFAAESDDAAMLTGVQRAMDSETKTVAKRNQSMVARQAGR